MLAWLPDPAITLRSSGLGSGLESPSAALVLVGARTSPMLSPKYSRGSAEIHYKVGGRSTTGSLGFNFGYAFAPQGFSAGLKRYKAGLFALAKVHSYGVASILRRASPRIHSPIRMIPLIHPSCAHGPSTLARISHARRSRRCIRRRFSAPHATCSPAHRCASRSSRKVVAALVLLSAGAC